jgi:hypothetical protein
MVSRERPMVAGLTETIQAAFDVAGNSLPLSGWVGYIISRPAPYIKKEKVYSLIDKHLISHIR